MRTSTRGKPLADKGEEVEKQVLLLTSFTDDSYEDAILLSSCEKKYDEHSIHVLINSSETIKDKQVYTKRYCD